MTVSVRTFDDGAWVSVDNERVVGVSELWRLSGFCSCEVGDVMLEAFVEADAEGAEVRASAVGRCIACGESGSMGWLAVGRLEEGEFRRTDPNEVQSHTTEP